MLIVLDTHILVSSMLKRNTKGIHIKVRKADFPLNHAVFLRSPRDRRVVWPIPALDEELVYIGTTDTDYSGSLDHVTATAEDVEYLLEVANHTLPESRLGYEHIVGTWAGLRPLVKPEGELAASSVSREHKILLSPSGLLNIAGGKLTTARVMGQQVIDEAIRLLGEHHGLRGVPASNSHVVPISGGEGGKQQQVATDLAGAPVSEVVRKRWAMFGGNARRLAEIARADSEAATQMGNSALTLAEVRYAVEDEMAQTLTDFFTRRAGIFYWTKDGGLELAGQAAAEMGRLLGWDATETRRQIDAYATWVHANRFDPLRESI